jgi:hypothetical protein
MQQGVGAGQSNATVRNLIGYSVSQIGLADVEWELEKRSWRTEASQTGDPTAAGTFS